MNQSVRKVKEKVKLQNAITLKIDTKSKNTIFMTYHIAVLQNIIGIQGDAICHSDLTL
jgi:hypothetical protein